MSEPRSAATTPGETVYFDPQRDALLDLLREGVEWVERPVETADDAAMCVWWLDRARAVLDASS